MSADHGVTTSTDGERNARCENCGTAFHCGMTDQACWCATAFPTVISGSSGAACLCPRCLAERIEQLRLT